MHMLSKIFNTLEKIASTNERILQAHDTMEKAAVTKTVGLLSFLKARKAYIKGAMNKNTNLTRQQALNDFYKRYGLQVGNGGHISAVEGAQLSKRALEMQQKWLSYMRGTKRNSNAIKKLKSKEQYGPADPAPVGNDLFNNNWWKYGLAGAGGFALGRTTAPDPQPMPVMMPPQPMPAMLPPQAYAGYMA